MKRFVLLLALMMAGWAISACQASEMLPAASITATPHPDEMPTDRSDAPTERKATLVPEQTNTPVEAQETDISDILPLVVENEEEPFQKADLIVGEHPYGALLYDVLEDTDNPETTEMWVEGASGDQFLVLDFANGDQYTFYVGKENVTLCSVYIQSDLVVGARGIKVGDSIASVLAAFRIDHRDTVGDRLLYSRSDHSVALYNTAYPIINREGVKEVRYDEPAGALNPVTKDDPYEENSHRATIEYAFPFGEDYAQIVQEENTSFALHGRMGIQFDENNRVASWYWDVHAYAE